MYEKFSCIHLLQDSFILCKIFCYYWLQLDRTDNLEDRIYLMYLNIIFIMTRAVFGVTEMKCV